MRSSFVLVCVLGLLGLIHSCTAQGQDNSPFAAPPDASALDKGLAEAKAELESATRKLKRAQRKTGVETTVKVIALTGHDVKKTAKALRKIYRDCPGFVVAPLPSMGALMIRADKKTAEEIVTILTVLRPIKARPAPGGRPRDEGVLLDRGEGDEESRLRNRQLTWTRLATPRQQLNSFVWAT